MRRGAWLGAALSLALLGPIGGTARAADIPSIGAGAPGLEADIDALVKDVIEELDLPGVSVAVSRKGKLVHAKGYGFANTKTKAKMDSWMRARIGSVTKATVTGPSAFKLIKAKGIDPKTKKLYGTGGVLGTAFDTDMQVGIKRHSPIIDTAIGPDDVVWAWHLNGTVSRGTTKDLDKRSAAVPFKLPAGKQPVDIRALSIAKNGKVYAWYDDGTRSIGSATDLGALSGGAVSLPKDKEMLHVVGVGIAKSNDHVYVWYEDGTVSSGTSLDFDAYFAPKPFTVGAGSGGTSYNIRGIDIAKNDHVYAWFGNGKVSSGISTDLDKYIAPYEYSLATMPASAPAIADWKSWYGKLTLQNLLDHRAGFTRNGDTKGAMALFDTTESKLTYEQVHKHFLRTRKLMSEPGKSKKYSNHGFGLWTLLIEKISGKSYKAYVRDNHLAPMGLDKRVLPERATPDCRDAWNHTLEGGKPVPYAFKESGLGLAAGGFRSSARDLTRITLELEGKYSHAELDAMGWEKSSTGKLSHNGRTDGGTAYVVMFPDGYTSMSGQDLSRVHVAIVTNIWTSTAKLESLSNKIALAAGAASIPASFVDMFTAKPAAQCP